MTPLTPGQPDQDSPRLLTRQHPVQQNRVPRVPLLGPGFAGRFRLRKLLIPFTTLLILTLLAALSGALYLRHSMRAALPQLDGILAVSGLSAPVTITRDPAGVPSINASTLDDLLFSQGYVTASDRLFQMDALRRHASGELAEILGASVIAHDRVQRTLQIRAAADRAIAVLPPDQLHQLEAYAHGVNAFIATHQQNLPIEFTLLQYHPAPWTPRDSLLVSLVMAQDLSTEFPQKLNRESLAAHLPANLIPDLYPVGSFRDHPVTQPTPDLTIPHEVLQIPLDDSQSSLTTPEDLLRISNSFTPCKDCTSGSNNWAVSASHSASGTPLLSNDMHLTLAAPDIWYEAALHNTGPNPLDVTGFTLPGLPFVIVGRNANVAWSFTALLADQQDVRLEHLRTASGTTEYQLPNGTWAPVQHHTELIRVRFGRDVKLDVQSTTTPLGDHTIPTPIISPLYPSEHRPLALAWPIYDPSTVTSPFLAVNSATDAESLIAALAPFSSPSLNLVVADAHHIAYHALGRIPIRGPAIQHPRDQPTPTIPTGAPPADEEDDADSASIPQPHLQLSNFIPTNNSGAPVGVPDGPHLPGGVARLASETWVRRMPRVAPKPRTRLKPPPTKPTPSDDIPPPPPAITYTIGSPISPVPVDALDPNQQWSGYIPYDQLPSASDPTSGVLATANSRVTADDYPYFIANDWVDPYRVERIHHLLDSRTQLNPAEMLSIQTDLHSELDLLLAQRLAYAIDHSSTPANKRLAQAADLLRTFSGDMAPSSPGAAIVSATRAELWPMLLTPQLQRTKHPTNLLPLYTWRSQNTALELLVQHTPARWLPPAYKTWDDLLAAAVTRALQHAPSNLSTWTYGAIHPVEIAHPIFGSIGPISKLLGTPTGSGYHPNGGDSTTVAASGTHFGPSERFTADLAEPDHTAANITTGQSGNPASPHFLDQFLPWLHGTTLPLPLNHPTTTHSLTLTPP